MKRYTQTVRYASRHTGVNFEKILTWGAIGVGVYLALEAFGLLKSAAGAVVTGYTSARDAVASGLYTWFGPEEKFGSNVDYIVRFPDGKFHAVPESAVSDQGVFRNSNLSMNYSGDGGTYQLVVQKTNRGNKVAFPL